MKSAYIFIHGNLSVIPDIKGVIQKNDLIICADGAAEFVFNQKITPDVIVGDLDSISTAIKKHFESTEVEWITYPREKDNTDTDLAIQYALKQKVDSIVILGLLGNRLDHMFSNLFHLAEIAKSIECKIIEGTDELYFVKDQISLKGKEGDELSLIPLQGNCMEVSTKGLYYPLQKETLLYGTTRGVSNVFRQKKVEISLKKGTLLVVHRHL